MRCLCQEPVTPVTVLTHDAVRVVEARLCRWPRLTLRRLSKEIGLRQLVIEQPKDEITAVFIPVSAPAAVQQNTCKSSGIAIGFMVCVKEFMCYNLLLLTKHVSASMATLVVKRVECGVLKHHIHSLKSLCIDQELHSFSITN